MLEHDVWLLQYKEKAQSSQGLSRNPFCCLWRSCFCEHEIGMGSAEKPWLTDSGGLTTRGHRRARQGYTPLLPSRSSFVVTR